MSEEQKKKHYEIHLYQRVVVAHDSLEDVQEAARVLHAQLPMLDLEVKEVEQPVEGPSRYRIRAVNGQKMLDKEPLVVASIDALKNLEAPDMEIAAIEGDRATRYVYRKQIPMSRIPAKDVVIGKMFESRHGGVWIERVLLQQRMQAEMEAMARHQAQQQGGQNGQRGVPRMG